jgi:hypothetical protein
MAENIPLAPPPMTAILLDVRAVAADNAGIGGKAIINRETTSRLAIRTATLRCISQKWQASYLLLWFNTLRTTGQTLAIVCFSPLVLDNCPNEEDRKMRNRYHQALFLSIHLLVVDHPARHAHNRKKKKRSLA